MRRFTLLLLLLLAPGIASSQTTPPVLFFTDIITGANSGGENTDGGLHTGVYVTLYGKGFGTTPTITVNGASCVRKVGAPTTYLWYQKQVVQLGSSCGTGNIVLTTSAGSTAGILFTIVPSGHIYFVSPTGNDSTGTGAFTSPWQGPIKAKQSMVAGDTVYLRAGSYTDQDNFSGALECGGSDCQGTTTAYKNFVGYPYETATIGSGAWTRGFYNWRTAVHFLTLANLSWIADTSAIACQNNGGGASCDNMRIIGNNMHSLGTGEGYDLEQPGSNVVIYGNDSNNNCTGGSCSYDLRAYSLYIGGFGTQSNIDIGWNALHDNPFGKGIQVYGHIAGDLVTGLKIHDNQIYNNTMVGILLGGSDGGTDFVQDAQVYNNLIWNNSNGADAGHMNFGGIAIQSLGSNDSYLIYNNTFYNNSPIHGGVQAGSSIAFQQNGTHSAVIKNNIFYDASSSPCYFYFDDNAASTRLNVTFSNNLYFNGGTGPSGCNYNVGVLSVNTDAGKVNANPQLVNPAGLDFHLASGSSPANGVGTSTLTTPKDFDGLVRPSPPSIGAFEFTSGAVASPSVSLPSNIPFNPQAVGTISPSQVVTLTNSGTATLNITSITLTGTNPSNFSTSSNTCTSTLTAGSSCTLNIAFNPISLNLFTANLTFITNASTSPNNVSISGSGALAGFMKGVGKVSGAGLIHN